MNDRQKRIVSKLLDSSIYMTAQELATEFEVSERTVGRDLHLISLFLNESFPQVKLVKKKGTGIKLIARNQESRRLEVELKRTGDSTSKQEQLRYLLIFQLLTAKSYLSLDELAETTYTNRQAVRKMLSILSDYFEKNELKIISKPRVGTFVSGDEQYKRRLLVKILRNIERHQLNEPQLRQFFSQEKLAVIRRILMDVLKDNSLTIPQELSSIDIHIYFMLERMATHANISLSSKESKAVADTKAQVVSTMILKKLATIYPVDFSLDEINYLALRIITLTKLPLGFRMEAEKLANHLIEQVEFFLDFSFKEDQQLRQNLTLHLASTLFRLNYDLTIFNPLLKTISSTYTQLFLINQLVLEDYFKESGVRISQDETAYLTIHFQAAIEQSLKKKKMSYQTVLISDASRSLTIFSEARLAHELPELTILKTEVFQSNLRIEQDSSVDFILTTVPMTTDKVPVIEISPLISEVDLACIRTHMLEHQPKKRVKKIDLTTFTQPFLIFPQLDETDPRTILELMCQKLIENHYVEPQFLKSVLERDQTSTQIASLITMPHGDPKYVHKSTIVIATTQKVVGWGTESVRMVLLLAIKKSDLKNDEFKKLFSMLHFLEQSPQQLEKVITAVTSIQLMQLLSVYEEI